MSAYRTMVTIRRFEETVLEMRLAELIQGSTHPCGGQEAIPVGSVAGLREDDPIVATYRGHGWAIAAGVPLPELLAELAGKSTGVNAGRGGSAYFSDIKHRFMGENSIVGAGVPIAGGLALASRVLGTGRVAIVSFGDGATNQGATHEGLVMAVARRLPVVFVCENNGWSEMTHITATVPVSLRERAAAYGLAAVTVDGNDVAEVAAAVEEAATRARAGEGPSFIEARTFRLWGHYNADAEHYRDQADRDRAAAADPLPRLRVRLLGEGVAETALAEAEGEAAAAVATARKFAIDSPPADAATAATGVTRNIAVRAAREPSSGVEMTYAQAVNQALERELSERPNVVVFGEDVAIPGGVFGVTRGLQKEFGNERVFDTPISEAAILGAAIGSSIAGLRPIAEVMWVDFMLVAFDQLVNQAANVRYVSNQEMTAPLVVRCQQGATPGSCAQHSQSLEALIAHIPGLRVGLPATPNDAYAMLRAAVADEDPCVIIEARRLYQTKGLVDLDQPIANIGGSVLRREGSDLALITWGTGLAPTLEAAEALEQRGISASVLDLRWLNPLDTDAIASVTAAASRVLIVHEANLTGGFGAEIAARIAEHHFFDLDAPVARVATPDVRLPAAPTLAHALIPNADRIVARALRLLSE